MCAIYVRYRSPSFHFRPPARQARPWKILLVSKSQIRVQSKKIEFFKKIALRRIRLTRSASDRKAVSPIPQSLPVSGLNSRGFGTRPARLGLLRSRGQEKEEKEQEGKENKTPWPFLWGFPLGGPVRSSPPPSPQLLHFPLLTSTPPPSALLPTALTANVSLPPHSPPTAPCLCISGQ